MARSAAREASMAASGGTMRGTVLVALVSLAVSMPADASGSVLTDTIEVSDERGEAEYRQIFKRVG
jgi:hypothetical protein